MPETKKEEKRLVAEIIRQRTAGKSLRQICLDLKMGWRRFTRLAKVAMIDRTPARKKPAQKKAAPPKPAQKECGCGKKCQPMHIHALAIASPLLQKFLMALEFACSKIFSLGVEQGKKEKAAAKPPKK